MRHQGRLKGPSTDPVEYLLALLDEQDRKIDDLYRRIPVEAEPPCPECITVTVCSRRYDGTFTAGSPDNFDMSGCAVSAGDLVVVTLAQNSTTSGACGGPGVTFDVPGANDVLGTHGFAGGAGASCQTRRVGAFWFTATSTTQADGIDFTHTDPRSDIGYINVFVISGASEILTFDKVQANFSTSGAIGPWPGASVIITAAAPGPTGPSQTPTLASGTTAFDSGIAAAAYPSDGSADTVQGSDLDSWAGWMLVLDNVSPGPFVDPGSIPGNILWLDANEIGGHGDGDTVGFTGDAWVDQSPLGNDVETSTLANAPLYKTGILNSRAVVRFDGSNDRLSNAAVQKQIGTDNWCMWAVVSNRATGTVRQNFLHAGTAASNGVGMAVRANSGFKGMLRGGIAWHDSSEAEATGFEVWVMQRRAGTLRLWIDGGAPVLTHTSAPNAPSANLEVGYDGGNNPADVDIAEIGIHRNAATSLDDANNIGNYLADKWGLTWTSATDA